MLTDAQMNDMLAYPPGRRGADPCANGVTAGRRQGT